MLENIQAYLSKQGVKYIKPEKAGPHQEEMEALKNLGQAAHKGNTVLIKSSRGASRPHENGSCQQLG